MDHWASNQIFIHLFMAFIILTFLPIFLLVKLQVIRQFAGIYSKDLSLRWLIDQLKVTTFRFQKLISNFLLWLFLYWIISNWFTKCFFLFNINSKVRLFYLVLFIFTRYQIRLVICNFLVSLILVSFLTFYLQTSIILTY